MRDIVRKPFLAAIGILFGNRLRGGLMASKLQFNAHETTSRATKVSSAGLCVKLWGCCDWSRGGSYLFFKASAQRGLKTKNLMLVFLARLSILCKSHLLPSRGLDGYAF